MKKIVITLSVIIVSLFSHVSSYAYFVISNQDTLDRYDLVFQESDDEIFSVVIRSDDHHSETMRFISTFFAKRLAIPVMLEDFAGREVVATWPDEKDDALLGDIYGLHFYVESQSPLTTGYSLQFSQNHTNGINITLLGDIHSSKSGWMAKDFLIGVLNKESQDVYRTYGVDPDVEPGPRNLYTFEPEPVYDIAGMTTIIDAQVDEGMGLIFGIDSHMTFESRHIVSIAPNADPAHSVSTEFTIYPNPAILAYSVDEGYRSSHRFFLMQ